MVCPFVKDVLSASFMASDVTRSSKDANDSWRWWSERGSFTQRWWQHYREVKNLNCRVVVGRSSAWIIMGLKQPSVELELGLEMMPTYSSWAGLVIHHQK